MFRYTRRQILLHWGVAALVLMQFLFNEPMGQAFDRWMDQGQKVASGGVILHIVTGVAIFVLVVWRLIIRRNAPKAPEEPGLLGMAAKLTHGLLYLLLLLLPLTGLAAWVGGIEAGAEMHEIGTTLLLVLIALHVAAALYHQLVLKDGLLGRMRPGA